MKARTFQAKGTAFAKPLSLKKHGGGDWGEEGAGKQ